MLNKFGTGIDTPLINESLSPQINDSVYYICSCFDYKFNIKDFKAKFESYFKKIIMF